jgi:cellulose biosynthesis protein BcsQ
MNSKVIVIVNNKGGSGKTTTSTAVAFALAKQNKEFSLLEIDSHQDSSLTISESELFKNRVNSVNLNESSEALAAEIFKMMKNGNHVIIDAGAGAESLTVISRVKDMELDNVIWIIPIQNSGKQLQNLKTTYLAISEPENTFVLKNQVLKNDDYIFFEGSKKYNKKSVRKELGLKKVLELPHSELFELAELSNQTLFDVAQLAIDLTPAQARKEFLQIAGDDMSKYLELDGKYNMAKDSLKLLEEIEINFKELLDEC